ncbi:MAG: UTP--glucose-1-phosphate uridylyltransferase [Armatimonadetes bacterium]|nr:UTP--glucose-1-phosphate uridylyltransferase [Armatimonadota bacterium]
MTKGRTAMERLIQKAVVPAAGKGSRLLPATKSQPKEMLPVGRKPVIQYVIEELASANVNNVLIITGRKKRSIEDHFDEDADWGELEDELLPSAAKLGVQIFYVRQSQPLGLGHAVSLAQDFTGGEPFIVSLGDSIIWTPRTGSLLQRIMHAHLELKAAATIAVETVPKQHVSRYGIVAPAHLEKTSAGEAMRLADIVEKPSVEEAPSRFAVAARYIFEPVIYDALRETPPSLGNEIQLTDAIRLLVREGYPVYALALEPDEQRWDIGNFESYFKAFVQVAMMDEECGSEIRKFVKELLGGTQ